MGSDGTFSHVLGEDEGGGEERLEKEGRPVSASKRTTQLDECGLLKSRCVLRDVKFEKSVADDFCLDITAFTDRNVDCWRW
eukprot:3042361-Pyramimonas_sp.AAC.1